MKKLEKFPEDIVAKVGEQYNKSFHSKVFTLFASSETQVKIFSDNSPAHFDFCFCFLENEQAQWFLDQKGIHRIRKWILDGAQQGTDHVMKKYRQWKKDWHEYISCSEKLLDKDLSKLSDKNLLREFKRFYQLYLGAGSVAYMADSFMSTGETDWLEEMFKKVLKDAKLGGDEDEILRTLLSPGFLSFGLAEELDLLGLAIKFSDEYSGKLPSIKDLRRKSPQLYKLLIEHRRQYYWISNGYYQADAIKLEEFYQRLQKIIATEKGNLRSLHEKKVGEIEGYKKKRQQIIASLDLDKYHRNVLDISDLLTEWKDMRKSGVFIGIHHFECFLAEIGRRAGIPIYDMTFLVPDEAYSVLEGEKIDELKDKISKRKKQVFFAVTTEGYCITGGKEADKYFKHYRQQQSKETSELRGVAASPGEATGVARVVYTAKDMKNFQAGEILVANQTTPDFVPIMKKAAAIVTEQGGITSHAAVVSRELKKPCVIGTKIATKAFQTGDKIKVDANEGIAQKL